MPLELISPDEAPASASSGLRHNILSPLEVLSQSISAIAPTTSPALTVPLIFAEAGNGTWLSYLLAATAMLLMALSISYFARTSASPGSLYKFATDSLPPWGGAAAGWALLLAYVATGSSVVGGFINYTGVLLRDLSPSAASHLPAAAGPLLAIAVTTAATLLAYRDVQTSTRLMLWIEAASVSMILVVLAILVVRHGPHVDTAQLKLQNVTLSQVRLGVVLSIFSFVGFESATTLGHEARNPLRTIPRALIQSAVLSGLFFLLGSYVETFSFRQLNQNLATSDAPFHALAPLAHVPIFAPLIDIGAFVSMFACTLACITAAARVLLKMAHDGLAHPHLGRAHAKNETPHIAVLVTGAAVLVPAAVLSARGVSGMDIYGYMGSLAVYGFLTIYFLVAAALPVFLRRRDQLTAAATVLAVVSAGAMVVAMAGTLYPVPDKPYDWLPYIYLAYLLAGLVWFAIVQARQRRATA
ncbi:MAG TPA: APC family permease [Acidobacteriaceae bacterium]|nr:APC family permease [Acidobacteriaceae bacterium]